MSWREESGTPLSFEVNGLCYHGLAWGDTDGTPVLALHGWLDNAASFSRLAPLMAAQGCHVVAVDLSGHGHTDHRAAHGSYQIWDDLPELVAVVDALGWDAFMLMGHSRGAIISTLLASALPERIVRLVLLDGLVPEPVDADKFPQQMRKALDDKPRLLRRKNRIYNDSESAIASRELRGMQRELADVLCRRNLREVDGGVTWRTDSRLHGASPVKMTPEQSRAVLGALSMPTLLILASGENSAGRDWLASHATANIPHLQLENFSGSHHFHMEENVAQLAEMILKFLQ